MESKNNKKIKIISFALFFFPLRINWTERMTQHIYRPEGLSSVLGTHVVEGENYESYPLFPLYAAWHVCATSHDTHKIKTNMINFLPKERAPRATLYGGLLTLAPRMLSFLKSEFQITPIPCRDCFCRTLQNLVIIITFFLYTLGFPHTVPGSLLSFLAMGFRVPFFQRTLKVLGVEKGLGSILPGGM